MTLEVVVWHRCLPYQLAQKIKNLHWGLLMRVLSLPVSPGKGPRCNFILIKAGVRMRNALLSLSVASVYTLLDMGFV